MILQPKKDNINIEFPGAAGAVVGTVFFFDRQYVDHHSFKTDIFIIYIFSFLFTGEFIITPIKK